MFALAGKEAEKLPNEIRVDCVTINCLPLKVAIDAQIQTVFDALVGALRRRVTGEMAAMDKFLHEATEFMQGVRPQSMREIGEANARHAAFDKERDERWRPACAQVELFNRLLRSVAGAGVPYRINRQFLRSIVVSLRSLSLFM